MRTRDRRLGKLAEAIEVLPVRLDLIDEAYPWFREFGELPDEDLVARAVIRRAMHGGDEGEESGALEFEACNVRAALFHEALFEHLHFRPVARAAIASEVAGGGNVESPGFAARHGLPMFGTVAMHMLGYPRRWITPPYELQGERLLTRWDELRARIDQRNPKWADPIAKALTLFRTSGELPKDELVLALVLADTELDQLRAHKKGIDVSGAMALLARAQGEPAERAEALQALCELAKAGRLR